MTRLTPAISNSIRISRDFLSQPYKFEQGVWTDVAESDLGYLMSPFCPYSLREEHEAGPWHLVYRGVKKTSVRHLGKRKGDQSLSPGQRFSVPRYIAAQLLRRADVEPDVEVFREARSVLVTRDGGLGDVFLTLPAVAELLRQNPELQATYATVTANIPVIEHCGLGINAVSLGQVYETGGSFDTVVELARLVEAADDRARTHRADIFARRFGLTLSDYSMPYLVREDEGSWAAGLLSDVQRPLVIVQAAGSDAVRTPPKEKLQSVILALKGEGFSSVVVDNRLDPGWNVDLNLTGMLDVAQLMAVLDQGDVVLCGDSGVLHAANALGKRTVGLFGSVKHHLRVKGQPNCVTIDGNQWTGCPGCNDSPWCGDPGRCLASVPDDVIVGAVLSCR